MSNRLGHQDTASSPFGRVPPQEDGRSQLSEAWIFRSVPAKKAFLAHTIRDAPRSLSA